MTASDRWVRWRLVPRGDRMTKVPVKLDGAYASSTDSSTWASYSAVAASKVGNGVGWVLGNGIGCVDLDHSIVDGNVEPWALEIVDSFPDAILVEVSQSGEGIHIFAPMEAGRGQVIRDGRNVEIYPPDSGRFIAVTGNRLKMRRAS